MSEVGTDDKYFIAKQTEMVKKREEKQRRVGWDEHTGGRREREMRRWNEGRSRTGERDRGTQADPTSKSPDLSEALHY
ncbi:hypothetical protein QQF64_008898 [Cirrhinus molitorella]|uniref:Uncharacterized protein n=1 Tax=Cirrhinus molitorella TaxID=172907 RepID=A0ABR3M9W8_9TELE